MAHHWTSFMINLQIQVHNIFHATYLSIPLFSISHLIFGFCLMVRGGEKKTFKTNHMITILFMVCKGKKPCGDFVNSNFDRQFSHNFPLFLKEAVIDIFKNVFHSIFLLCLFLKNQ